MKARNGELGYKRREDLGKEEQTFASPTSPPPPPPPAAPAVSFPTVEVREREGGGSFSSLLHKPSSLLPSSGKGRRKKSRPGWLRRGEKFRPDRERRGVWVGGDARVKGKIQDLLSWRFTAGGRKVLQFAFQKRRRLQPLAATQRCRPLRLPPLRKTSTRAGGPPRFPPSSPRPTGESEGEATSPQSR